ncbi:hypothetical protein FT641_20065 [Bacillus paranthracis]|uniref:hypothetical protein n=1 Tax=Bacillus paranthracis TaxID=2026186 RepID=UPI00187927C6|nr:hypothetical protein [Bacillus paranthracis]MBE7114642.1 hypothetical protein [Bacillus paranthracis]MBE7154991.1 hypothetical protein [Bacillus paranthracis]
MEDVVKKSKPNYTRYLIFWGSFIGMILLFSFGVYSLVGESKEVRLVEKKLNLYPKVSFDVEDYKLLKSTTIVRDSMYKGYDSVKFVTGDYDNLTDVYIAKVTYVDEENLRYTIEQPVKVQFKEDVDKPTLHMVKVTDKLDSIGEYVNPVLQVKKS